MGVQRQYTGTAGRVEKSQVAVHLAHAFLAAATADERAQEQAPDDLIPLTCNEIQHLFTTLVARTVHTDMHGLRWSEWRRRHQARARACHYQRRTARQP
ncbi:hypothetical protein GCM10027073_06300 [Streptomyces chlorus]